MASEFSVHKTWGGGHCLVLDGERIAGGKPEISANNCVEHWNTRETYGPVDAIRAENARLRELVREIWVQADLYDANEHIRGMRVRNEYGKELERRMRELGVEVDDEDE